MQKNCRKIVAATRKQLQPKFKGTRRKHATTQKEWKVGFVRATLYIIIPLSILGRELADLLGMMPVRQDKLCLFLNWEPGRSSAQRNVRARSSPWIPTLD